PEGLLLNRAREFVALAIGPVHIALPQTTGGCEDRRERRSQLVGYSVQKLGLELVSAAKGLGLRGVLPKARTLKRDPKLCRVDGHGVQIERRSEVLGDGADGPFQLRFGHEERGLIKQLCIAFAVLGFLRSGTLARGERTGDDRGDQEEGEGEELLSVRDDELVRWRHEEPVEGQERKHARDDRRRRAKGHRDQ